MHRLKDAYRGERAAVVLGGPSLVASKFDFGFLRKAGFVTFLESKALTPYLLATGFEADFYMMFFPEKCTQSSLQNFVYRAFMAKVEASRHIKRAFRPVVDDMKTNFDRYLEVWRPHRSPHKRLRFKRDVYLKDSPLDLLGQLASTKVIANRALVRATVPSYVFHQDVYWFAQDHAAGPFDIERYYHPEVRDGELTLAYNEFYNSAAIVLYPLLRYLGFADVYFLGMDMSMIGSLEFGAPFTFKSMLHYWWFFHRTSYVFNHEYKMNRPYYLRPKSEFTDLPRLLNRADIRFTRVYDPFKYAAEIPDIPTISTSQFMAL
jgi:hypothetical protein